MWGRLAACAAVGYRRCPVANAGGTLWVRPIANRPQLTKLPHNTPPEVHSFWLWRDRHRNSPTPERQEPQQP